MYKTRLLEYLDIYKKHLLISYNSVIRKAKQAYSKNIINKNTQGFSLFTMFKHFNNSRTSTPGDFPFKTKYEL